jgi:hypothetical protein
MSAKTYTAFLILLVATSGGVYYVSYDIGITDGYEDGYTFGRTTGYEVGHEDGYNEGHDTGYTSGNSSGYTLGYQSGNLDGNNTGFSTGYEEGSMDGYETGFESGYVEGNDSGYLNGYSSGQIKGNESGYIVGYNLGFDLGNTSGFDYGYLTGLEDGAGSGYTIRNPTYSEVLSFLWRDKTDENVYIDDVYVCRHFTSDVLRHAFEEGFRSYFVYIGFGNLAHALVGFNTTDRGMVYIEPQTDDRVYPVMGEVYWDRSKYHAPPYDDTITEILVIG